MIPKIIHYCWLTNNPFPKKIEQCINSWKNLLPDYEFVLWNLDIRDIQTSIWVKEAYEAKKYAFAADYIRFYALYNKGGIYLDSDVEVVKPFDDLLELPYFLGRENVSNNIEAAAMGCQPGLPWIKECLDYYEGRHFINQGNQLDTKPLPLIMQEMISSKYGLIDIDSPLNFDRNNSKIQTLPSEFFSPKNYMNQKIHVTGNTYCIHHFTSSWRSTKDIFLNRIEGMFGKKTRVFFWLFLRNPIYNIRGLLRLIKERRIWWK